MSLLAASLAGAVTIAGLGWLLVSGSFVMGSTERPVKSRGARIVDAAGEGLARLSYDLQFVFRGGLVVPEACLVYLDERAGRALGQRMGVWDRKRHAELIRRLTEDGARAIFFDLVFADPWPDPAVDEELAAAVKAHGRVFLGGALEFDGGANATQERTIPPTRVLRSAAAGWGLLAFRPVDSDYGVRRLYTGMETIPSAPWIAAQRLGAELADTPEERARWRWLNYYGRADSIENVGYDRALDPQFVPPGFFRDRIVVVGGRSTLGELRLGKDDFRNPFSLIGQEFSKGPEVHLTALLNLLHREWLERLDHRWEAGSVLVLGLLVGGLLPWLRPHFAAFVAVLIGGGIVALSMWLFVQHRTWFAWCIPVLVQLPVGLVWAVGARYFLEERRRNALRSAFAHYLSPQMADRIADADFDLALGGTVVEATVMFTDLENFSTLSEELDNPQRISDVLTTYFTQTTRHILENDGTILKYLGDSVQAVWGTPLADDAHARKAVLAAWRLHEASIMEVQGHPLRTRVGVNTGLMLSGNLGSAQRFDYAVTGDAVNFASRLEGMNKYLGTSVLISETVKERIGNAFLTRCAGEFRVVGKKQARVIHELLGPAPAAAPPTWLETFNHGLTAFRAGDLDAAESALRATIAARGIDGPSFFYLARIAELRRSGVPPGWTGIVDLSAK